MKRLFIIVFTLLTYFINAQELFPNNLPASTIPKGVLGVRAFDETYKEINIFRNLSVLRLMYGLTSRLTLMASGSVSNHHSSLFPPNLVSHTHNGNQSVFSTGNFQRGVQYPYQYNGIYLYAQYRFLSIDGQNKHFRMALYTDWSNVNVAHDEAEPDLTDDNKGYGAGLITTWLYRHFAVSLTSGFIKSGLYNGYAPDMLGGPDVPTQIQYGDAVKYNLSFGYLLYPFTYKNYNEVNISLYTEFEGKSYTGAKVIQYTVKDVPIQTPLLQAGSYVEVHPGIQVIVKSNLRVDFSAGFPMLNQSYAHFAPIYMIGIQRYFYFNSKPKNSVTLPRNGT